MSSIFLSYASVDRPAAARIEAALSARGHDVFWDQEVPPGSDWDTWIRTKLDAAKVAIVLWSKASIKSPNVRHEAMVARDAGKLVPAMIEPLAAGDFPMGLYLVQGVQMDDWRSANSAGLARLVNEVESRLGRPVPTGQTSRPPPRPAQRRASPLPLIIGACAIVAVAAAGAYWMLQKNPGASDAQVADGAAPVEIPASLPPAQTVATPSEDPCTRSRLDWESVESSSDIAVLETFLVATPDTCTIQRAQAEARIKTVRDEKLQQDQANAETKKIAAFKAAGGDFLGTWQEYKNRDRTSAGCWRWYRISQSGAGLVVQFGNDEAASEGRSMDLSIQGTNPPVLAFPDGWTFRIEAGFMSHYSPDNVPHTCRWVKR